MGSTENSKQKKIEEKICKFIDLHNGTRKKKSFTNYFELLKKKNFEIFELLAKQLTWMITSNNLLRKKDYQDLEDISLYKDYGLIQEICLYFDIALVIFNENKENYIIGNEERSCYAIYMYRSKNYQKPPFNETYSLVYPDEITKILFLESEYDPDYDNYYRIENDLDSNLITIFNLCKLSLKKNQSDQDAVFTIIKHLLRIVHKNPSMFPAYIALKSQLFPKKEICYACQKLVSEDDFYVVCIGHEEKKFCYKHFLDFKCPECFRDLNELKNGEFFMNCINCGEIFNSFKNCCSKNNCRICNKCLLGLFCECENFSNLPCEYQHQNIIKFCNNQNCGVCLDCLQNKKCLGCNVPMKFWCIECSNEIENNLTIYENCFDYVHKDCKKLKCSGCYFEKNRFFSK